jgi:hypothetical protein
MGTASEAIARTAAQRDLPKKKTGDDCETYLSASLVRTTGNTLSDSLPIGLTVVLCNGFRKKEIFIGRPWTTSDPFSHSTEATKGERRVPERQLEPCLTCKPSKTFKFGIR